MDHGVKYCVTGISWMTKAIASGWKPHTHSRALTHWRKVVFSVVPLVVSQTEQRSIAVITAQNSSRPH